MATRFVGKRTHRFYFVNDDDKRASYVVIFGDEVETLSGAAPSGGDYRRVRYRGREGEWVPPPLLTVRPTELYFLDVGQGDAAYVVTPNGTTMLVDGGLKALALGFLIWKYRLDEPGHNVTVDHLFLSHADKDHVEGLIPLLDHDKISVRHIWHNGIGLFDSGFTTEIGDLVDGKLTTLHSSTQDLDGLDLASGNSAVFDDWITAVRASGATYERLDRSRNVLDIGDPAITLEITGPVLEPDGSLRWLDDKSHTINGHSLTFRLVHDTVRTFFSGDLNRPGSDLLLATPPGPLSLDAHVLKAPHHGSHDYSDALFAAVRPMLTVISSGEVPDHGHPRASFLGAIGRASRGPQPLLFSTALAALFVDVHDPQAVDTARAEHETGTEVTVEEIRFDDDPDWEAHQLFKKVLPGIINVRTDGTSIYAFRRVQQSYQWEAYGPIAPVV